MSLDAPRFPPHPHEQHVRHIMLGEARRLWMPDLGRLGGGVGRTRGLRLVVMTPPTQAVDGSNPLSAEDRPVATRTMAAASTPSRDRHPRGRRRPALASRRSSAASVRSVERTDVHRHLNGFRDYAKELERIADEVEGREAQERRGLGGRWRRSSPRAPGRMEEPSVTLQDRRRRGRLYSDSASSPDRSKDHLG